MSLLFFPADALYRARINCILDEFYSGPMRVVNFCNTIVIHPKDIRTTLFTVAASDTLILINKWYSCHDNPRYFKYANIIP